ncbi:DUF488 domain-containing protein [Luteolibacter sp. SL250]|uniref:DUF488 domain-containing protein n=1 Tax=Luteolibacter sp. SL250 TaxID=2995170 RepID=UPI00226E812B|nr:DUF488 domain-containing protein [Luteolibacter sp. SL250]WAC18158.1 DUF488 domain-containing protein [Luteolibacter sp. SL250]
MKIHLKRVYEPSSREDGSRFLVDRIWPRGVSKKDLGSAVWLKEIAPSTELRKWFNHDPERWQEFRKRYLAELRSLDAPAGILRAALKEGPITLLHAARDEEHNHALVLRDFLLKSG